MNKRSLLKLFGSACLGLIVFILTMTVAYAQAQEDAEVWTGVRLNKRITDNVLIRVRQEVRINNNITTFKSAFTDIGLHYSLNKFIKVTANYRYANDEKGLADHRASTDLRLRYKIKPFIFSIRNRFQHEYQFTENGIQQEVLNRNKFQIAFDLDKKISPFLSSEFYYDYYLSQVNKVRYTLGFDLDLKNRMGLSLFYRLQTELNVANPNSSYIIGIGYSYRLKGKLLKKKD